MSYSSSQTLATHSAAAVQSAAPRSAQRALALVGRAGGAVWRCLESVGEQRANRELRLLAARWAVTDPEMAMRMHGMPGFGAPAQATATPAVEVRS